MRSAVALMFRRRRSLKTRTAGRGYSLALAAFESLESRHAMSTLQDSPYLPAHALSPGSTTLAINFDGGSYGGNNVAAFSLGTAAQTDATIQDTLFRVAEIYAPFDVQVYRLLGGENTCPWPGATTVFVGPDQGASSVGVGMTPGVYSDYPRDGRLDHIRNSDPKDLAFVTPDTSANMAAVIAHEAGHTFGLWHVRVDGQTDPTPLQGLPANAPIDVMSYNRVAGLAAFDFEELPITNFNYNPDKGQSELEPESQPQWDDGSAVTKVAFTQNSYICLGQVLGPRPDDGKKHVADTAAISKQFVYGSRFVPFGDTVVTGNDGKAILSGTLERFGDYEVYRWTSKYDQFVTFSLAAVSKGLDPALMVYDDAGRDSRTVPNNLLYIDDAEGKRFTTAPAVAPPPGQMFVKAGQTLNFVVGARNGASTGSYRLQVQEDTRVHSVVITRAAIQEKFTVGTPAQQGTIASTFAVTVLKAPANTVVQSLPGGGIRIDYRGVGLDGIMLEIDVVRKAVPKKISALNVKAVYSAFGALGRPTFQVGYADGTVGTLISSQGKWAVRFSDGTTQETDVADSVKYNAVPLAKLTRVISPPAGIQLGAVRNVYLSDAYVSPTTRNLMISTSDGIYLSPVYNLKQTLPVVLQGQKSGMPGLSFSWIST